MSIYFGGFNVSEKMFSAFGGLIPPIDRPGLRSTACKRAGDAKKKEAGDRSPASEANPQRIPGLPVLPKKNHLLHVLIVVTSVYLVEVNTGSNIRPEIVRSIPGEFMRTSVHNAILQGLHQLSSHVVDPQVHMALDGQRELDPR